LKGGEGDGGISWGHFPIRQIELPTSGSFDRRFSELLLKLPPEVPSQ